jgi:hypothetical protein
MFFEELDPELESRFHLCVELDSDSFYKKFFIELEPKVFRKSKELPHTRKHRN